MIESIQLERSGIKTSRLGFGTSRLHHVKESDRLRLLELAADFGIVHFDTAPSYGDGLAERELGKLLQGRRDRFVVATKVGFEPDSLIGALPSFSTPLRGMRAIARRFGFWESQPVPLTPAYIRDSTERSLRRLRTDWIDILFLHEPTLDSLPSPADALGELARLQEQGLIRAFGLAGGGKEIQSLLAVSPGLGLLVQTPEAEWPTAFPPDITYGAIAGGPQSYRSPAVAHDVALDRVRTALRRRPRGVVLISTAKPDHLRSLASSLQTL